MRGEAGGGRELIAAAGRPNERRGEVNEPAGRTWFCIGGEAETRVCPARRAGAGEVNVRAELGASRDATSSIHHAFLSTTTIGAPGDRRYLNLHGSLRLSAHSLPLYG